MTSTALHVAEDVADLPAAEWDALAGPDDVFLTTRWLRTAEAAAGVPFRYLWLSQDGTPAAALVTELATVDVLWMLGRPDAILSRSVEAGLPGAAEFEAGQLMPCVVAGGRHVGHTRVLFDQRATGEDVARLVAQAEKLAARRDVASVAFPYVDERDATLGAILRKRGFTSFVSGRYSRLALPPGGFGGYLARLSSKRRISIAAERRRIQEAGVEVVFEQLDQCENVTSLAGLESALLAKYGIDWEQSRAQAILGQIGGAFGPDAFVVVARAGGVARGFILVLAHGDQWYARQAGFDYAFQQETRLPLYFELTYYRLIEEAARAGVTTIHYGLGSESTKRSRGCEVTDQRCWVRRTTGGDG